MNSISPSYIFALLGKCRYSAASDTTSRAASAAVVIFSGFGASSIAASVCRIITRRSPGFGRARDGVAFFLYGLVLRVSRLHFCRPDRVPSRSDFNERMR